MWLVFCDKKKDNFFISDTVFPSGKLQAGAMGFTHLPLVFSPEGTKFSPNMPVFSLALCAASLE